MYIYIILLLLYSVIPPLTLFYILKLIYHDKNKYGIHLHYMARYLFSLSFLPLLFIPKLNLGLIPHSPRSVLYILVTFILIVLGIKRAMKFKNLYFYFNGVTAAFMEEILYRGIIFGLLVLIFKNQWISLIISSLLFGTWHLKNYYWSGKKGIINQFLYTALFYGPVFCLMRIYTGDIYLAILFHYVTDATCALAPDWMRGWLVKGGRGKEFNDRNRI